MSLPAYNPDTATLEFKIEVALVKFLLSCAIPNVFAPNSSTPLATGNLFTGENAEPKILPAVICKCAGGPEEVPGSNTFLEDVTVCIDSNADLSNSNADPLPRHRQLVQAIKRALWDSKVDAAGIEWLHSYLSCQVPYLNMMREIKLEDIQDDAHGRHFTTEFKFKMACNEQPGLPDAQADYAAGRLVLGNRPEDKALLGILMG